MYKHANFTSFSHIPTYIVRKRKRLKIKWMLLVEVPSDSNMFTPYSAVKVFTNKQLHFFYR